MELSNSKTPATSPAMKWTLTALILSAGVSFSEAQTNISEFVLRAPASTNRLESRPKTTSQLNEEARSPIYGQPEWTSHRRFSTTRIYLQKAPWEVGFEQWWRGRFHRDNSASHLFQEEIEIGLPHRTQLDIYENWTSDDDGHLRHHDVAAELRYALADWGKIPLNPTIYGEWKFVDPSQGADVFEIKLLLGEQLAPRWHWGLNAVWEQEVGQARATELALSQGVSYTAIDEKLSVGLEMVFKHETEKSSRDEPELKFLLGPSLQWRPCHRTHLDIVPLAGLTHDSPRVEAFIILGIDLWSKTKNGKYAPSSLRGN
jgi:hypothetical protein